jgi:hypothetical protein
MKKSIAMTLLILMYASLAKAQAAQVIYDFNIAPLPPASQVQAWTASLFVNGTRFPLADTCVLTTVAPIVIRCTATLPNISAALTPSGTQTFEVAWYDTIPEMESAKSSPLVLVRPSAPSTLRIQ